LNKNNDIKKYSKGENTNFNFLLPSKSCIQNKKSRIKYGNIINEKKIPEVVKKIKNVNEKADNQPFYLSFDGTSVRSGYLLHKSGFIFGGAKLLQSKDLNQDSIFKNKSKEIVAVFINFPLIKLSFLVSIFNIYTENNEEFVYQKIDNLIEIFTKNNDFLKFTGTIIKQYL
jgi:hypothetical protein